MGMPAGVGYGRIVGRLIRAGERTLDDVPARWRDAVEALLNPTGTTTDRVAR